ncbi:MAG: hypothetical protein ACLVJ6_04830 [Merdibacter sp.]
MKDKDDDDAGMSIRCSGMEDRVKIFCRFKGGSETPDFWAMYPPSPSSGRGGSHGRKMHWALLVCVPLVDLFGNLRPTHAVEGVQPCGKTSSSSTSPMMIFVKVRSCSSVIAPSDPA